MTPLVKNCFHIERREQPFLYSPYHGRPTFHAHPEFELLYILKGSGQRIIGNNLSTYSKGDMVFLGSNLPHIWLSDQHFVEEPSTEVSEAIVMYINPGILEQMFDLLPEFETIKDMTESALRGIFIFGEAKKRIAEKLEHLFDASGYDKVEGFMSVLNSIAVTKDKAFICDSKLPVAGQFNSDRLPIVIEYIQSKLSDTISLTALANLAFMSTASFCRFFKTRMHCTPFQYILEQRMELARKLLIERDKPVYEIARHSGYNSDAHFCKIFKAHFGISPYRYKLNIQRISSLSGV